MESSASRTGQQSRQAKENRIARSRRQRPRCVVCGGPFMGTYMKDFRAFLPPRAIAEEKQRQSQNVHEHPLSGVGAAPMFPVPIWNAPMAENRHWNRDHSRAQRFTFMAMRKALGALVIHHQCWELMGIYQRIDRSKLFQVLHSCPLRDGYLHWEHHYGLDIEPHPCFPDEILIAGDLMPIAKFPWLDIPYGFATVRPQERVDVPPPCTSALLVPDTSTTISDISTAASSNGLEKLPYELRQHIISFLPSPDFCTLRQASRAFAAMGFTDAFWASRFQERNDLSYYFEVWEHPSPRPDWKRLYFATRHNLALPRHSAQPGADLALWMRAHIWANIGRLNALMDKAIPAQGAETVPPELGARYPRPGDWTPSMVGVSTEDNIHDAYYQATQLPAGGTRYTGDVCGTTGILISLLEISGSKYVTGLRFCFGPRRQAIGYIREETEMSLLWNGGNSRTTPFDLVGFRLAKTARGIIAIAAITATNEESDWVGSRDRPCVEQLVKLQRSGGAVSVKAVIDGLKLVDLSLAHWGPSSSPIEAYAPSTIRQQPQTNLPLQSYLWHPTLPPTNAYLSLAPNTNPPSPSRPLLLAHFRGDRAAALTSVTVRGSADRYHNVAGIEFGYASGGPITMGRGGRDGDLVAAFRIDGPGGERIVRFEVPDGRLDAEGAETQRGGIGIATSWGRGMRFPPEYDGEEQGAGGKVRWVGLGENEAVLTGLFGCWESFGVFGQMGVMFERLE